MEPKGFQNPTSTLGAVLYHGKANMGSSELFHTARVRSSESEGGLVVAHMACQYRIWAEEILANRDHHRSWGNPIPASWGWPWQRFGRGRWETSPNRSDSEIPQATENTKGHPNAIAS